MLDLMMVTLLALTGCGGAEPAAEGDAVAAADAERGVREDVDIAAFAAKHAEGVTVVDVRTDGEWAQGHVPGAIHVPLDKLSADHPAMKVLPKDEPVYFVCAVGGRSSRAADAMSKAGYHAVNVQGGTNGWVAAGHPVE